MEDSMPQWMQDLFAGWPMIRANLPTFFVILVMILGAVWWMMDWKYGATIASKTGQIELLDRQIADYKDKLKGASPEEAKSKIDSLEQTIKKVTGAPWSPLTTTEIAALAAKLKDIKPSRAQIMYENGLGQELAASIFEAFKQAGWSAAWLSPGSTLGDGIVVGWSSRAVAVKAALESTAGLKGIWAKDTEKEIADLLIVGVGINRY
jgi:hypothetical protein